MDESSDRDPWWLCRSRQHQWPAREHAEACCHTRLVRTHFGHGPDQYPGPEPALPLNGFNGPPDAAHCWILVEPERITEPVRFVAPPSEHAAGEDKVGPLGPWHPGMFAERDVVTTDAYGGAVERAREVLGRDVYPEEVERFVVGDPTPAAAPEPATCTRCGAGLPQGESPWGVCDRCFERDDVAG